MTLIKKNNQRKIRHAFLYQKAKRRESSGPFNLKGINNHRPKRIWVPKKFVENCVAGYGKDRHGNHNWRSNLQQASNHKFGYERWWNQQCELMPDFLWRPPPPGYYF